MADPAPVKPAPGARSFRNRVSVLVEIVDTPDEVKLATAAFNGQGWLVRSPHEAEIRGYPARNRVWLLLEVRFPGYPKPAVKVAVKRVDEVIERFQLGAWVRRAQVISHLQAQEVTYFVDQTAPKWLERVQGLTPILRFIGVPRTTGLIRLTGAPTERAVRARLSELELGQPFDPSRFSLRPSSTAVTPDGIPAPSERAPRPVLLLSVIALVAAAVSGAEAEWAQSGWKVIAFLIAAAMIAPVLLALPRNQPLRIRVAMATLLTILLTLCGVLEARETHSPGKLSAIITGALLAAFTIRGVTLALRDSWLARQITWVIPVTASVLAPFSLWLGGSYDAEYLGDFGIPSDAVSVPTFFRLSIAAESALIGLAFVLVFVAVSGWARYFHWVDDSFRWYPLFLVLLLSVVYLLGSIVIGLSAVNGAATGAAARARTGHTPASYFGLQGELECVHPVTAAIPVYNGPLPRGKPLLSFGAAGSRLWVWDPSTRRSIGVPLDDVTVTPATGVPAHCPASSPSRTTK